MLQVDSGMVPIDTFSDFYVIGRAGTEMDMSVVISRVLLNKAPASPKPPHSSHPAECTHVSIACACNFQFSPQPKIATKTFSVTVCVYLPCFFTLMKF